MKYEKARWGIWANVMVVWTTDHQIWVRFGKHLWKFNFGVKRL